MYKRKAYIEVYEKKSDTTPKMIVDGLRIKGEVQYAYDSSNVTARLEVYNLSAEARMSLMIKDKDERERTEDGAITATSHVKVYAGYEDEHFVDGGKPLILEGPIMNVFSFNKRPNVLTILYVVPAGQAPFVNKPVPFTAPPDMTLEQALIKLGKSGGYSVVDCSSLPEEIRNYSVRGKTIGTSKNLSQEFFDLGKEFFFMTRFTANKVKIKMQTNVPTEFKEKVGIPVQSQSDSGPTEIRIEGGINVFYILPEMVRENPRVGQASIKLLVSLAPELEHIDDIDMTKVADLLIYDDLGDVLYRDSWASKYLTSMRYRVSSITHMFDTHGPEWQTYIEAHVQVEGRSVENWGSR